LAWGLARSPHVDEVVCAPGNPGMAGLGECMPVSVTDAAAVVDLAAKLEPDLVVVGPEDPLVAGIVDALETAGWLAFGPSGAAGRTCVIEEGLTGPEVTLFALCDGRRAEVVATAQDHKRAFDGDTGPNTGGMGAYSPVPFVGAELVDEMMERAVLPTLAELDR